MLATIRQPFVVGLLLAQNPISNAGQPTTSYNFGRLDSLQPPVGHLVSSQIFIRDRCRNRRLNERPAQPVIALLDD